MNRNRNFSTSAVNTGMSSATSRLSPTSSNNTPMISFANDSTSLHGNNRTMSTSTSGQQQQQNTQYRKLDRSVSEPVGDRARLNSTTGSDNGDNANLNKRNNVNSSRYKTELCRPFEENGHCKYGDKCQFAHGVDELRNLHRHPKYKTEPCRTFHTIGYCPYGPRCHFIHNDEDEGILGYMKKMKVEDQQCLHEAARRVAVHQQQQHPQQNVVSRPKALNFQPLGSTADSPPSSVSDSPTLSLSPTFFGDDMLSPFSPVNTPMSAASTTAFKFNTDTSSLVGGHHQLPPSPPVMSPLNVHTTLASDLSSQLGNTLTTSGLQQHNSIHNHRNNNNSVFLEKFNDIFGAPPSPADSHGSTGSGSTGSSVGSTCSSGSSSLEMGTCGSPLDLSRSFRLPIFNKLSI